MWPQIEIDRPRTNSWKHGPTWHRPPPVSNNNQVNQMTSLPTNLSVERLDHNEKLIAQEIGQLRSLASDYAKRCSRLKALSTKHETEVNEFHQLLELLSRAHPSPSSTQQQYGTKTTDAPTTQPQPPRPHQQEHEEAKVVQELVRTFHHWTVRAKKRKLNQTNTIRSSYRRVKQSVINILGSTSAPVSTTTNADTTTGASNNTPPTTTASTTTTSASLATTNPTKPSHPANDKENIVMASSQHRIALHRAEESARLWRRSSDKLQQVLLPY